MRKLWKGILSNWRLVALAIIAFGLVLGVAAYFAAAPLVRLAAIGQAEAFLGGGALDFSMANPGVDGVRLENLRLGGDKGGDPLLAIDSIKLGYSPTSIRDGRVDTIRVDGMTVTAAWENGELKLNLPPPPSPGAAAEKSGSEADWRQAATFTRRCEIRGGRLVLWVDGRRQELPFEAQIDFPADKVAGGKATVRLFPRGEILDLLLELDTAAETITATLRSDNLRLSRFQDLLYDLAPGAALQGDATLNASATLAAADFAPRRLELELAVADIGFRMGALNLGAAEDGFPARISLVGGHERKYRFSLANLAIGDAAKADLGELILDLKQEEDDGWSFAGTAALDLSIDTAAAKASLPLRAKLAGGNNGGQWHFSFANTHDGGESLAPLTMRSGEWRFTFQPPDLSVNGRGDAAGWNVETKGRLDGVRVFQGAAESAAGAIDAIGFEIPWSSQPAAETAAVAAAGRMEFNGLRWGDLDVGGGKMQFLQYPDQIKLFGPLELAHIPGMATLLEFRYRFAPAIGESAIETAFSIPGHRFPADSELGALHPAMAGVRFDGEMEARLKVAVGAQGPRAELAVSAKNFNIDSSNHNAKLRGVNAELRFADLLALRSTPGQTIEFAELESGKIRLSDGQIRYQINSPTEFLLESARADWCGGALYTHALRFTLGRDEYQAVIYGDRVRLAEFLELLGNVKAEGEGTVSGRIPVRYADGNLTFDDGHLHTSPGHGGTLAVAGAANLGAGLGAGVELEFTTAALGKFAYEWARISFNTVGENLEITLTMNGKPAEPIPFELRGGAIVSSAKANIFTHPIQFDINLRFPINEFIGLGNEWNQLLK